MPYNPWYIATYQPILELANWKLLTADIEKKIIAIFSWMPTTVMSVRQGGGGFKWETYNIEAFVSALEHMGESFITIRDLDLLDTDVARSRVAIASLFGALLPLLGAVGASKYVHFSAPRLLPMWDSAIIKAAKFEKSSDSYIKFIMQFQQKLRVPGNLRAAKRRCPDNVVRGWDIVSMERR